VTLTASETTVDLACARREVYAHPGALPSVEPGTLEEDLARRDFSVNAFALMLAPAGEGALELRAVDGAVQDLEARRLRVLHERSFHDDPTRALRAARLSARLGFHLARPTLAVLRDALRDGVFGSVSGERLRREIEKLFDEATRGVDPSQALRRLESWHVLAALEPGLVLPRECLTSLRRLGRGLAQQPPWPLHRLRPWASGLSLWLAPLAPALRRRALRRLAIRGETAGRIADFPRRRRGWLRQLETARGRGAVDAVLSELDETELLALHASAPPLLRRRIVRYAAEDRGRRSPVTGADLVAAGLGGPAVGRALGRVRAAWLDGEVANREEALALARELGRRRSGRGGRHRTR
jgi:tRNA nucleotidyltransferase/poly(A) polymerase